MEKTFDFDHFESRLPWGQVKWEPAELEKTFGTQDVLPAWIADMDLKTLPEVQEAIIEAAKNGMYGYTKVTDEVIASYLRWQQRRNGWNAAADWFRFTPGVVTAINLLLLSETEEGDEVLIQRPVYYPFTNIIRDNDRRVIDNTLVYEKRVTEGKSQYSIDYEDFERKIVQENIKLFILCNPHNPVGRVWNREELQYLGEICLHHHVIVVSDEIHNDFVYPGFEHTVFANVDPRFAEFTVTCTAPSKTFNLAGLQISNIFISNETLREAFQKEIDKTGYDEPNALGAVACEAAYRGGQEWLDQLRAYLLENLNFLRAYLQEKIPQIHLVEPEGTYLVWLDCSELGISGKELDQFIVEKAGLWLDGGAMFGPSGADFQRVNIACPRATLELALDKLKAAVDNLG